MKLKLPASVSSSQDLSSLLLELHEYSSWMSHEAMKKAVNSEHQATSKSPSLSLATTELLNAWGGQQPINNHDIDELIEKIKEYNKLSSTITIILAAPPTVHLKQKLVSWCRENISPTILVNFQFNSTLLGGMVVRYGSRIFDWSFRRRIIADRNNFPEVLRHV